MVLDKPRLLFRGQTDRKKHMRRFLWGTLAAVGGLGAFSVLAQLEAQATTPINPNLLIAGRVLGIGVFAIFAVRALFALGRGWRLPTETVRLLDRGVIWERKDGTHKYAWRQLVSHRENIRTGALGRFKLWQWGEITLTMSDKRTFRLRPYHGDLREIEEIIRPYVGDELGTHMAQTLRNGKNVKVRHDFILTPKGVRVGKTAIPWRNVDISTRGGKLIVSRQDAKSGKFRPLVSYPTRRLENVPGVLEISQSLIQNHQPERFGIETQVGKVYQDQSKRVR